jgi:geranylgeranyl pyrophosphate synthase
VDLNRLKQDIEAKSGQVDRRLAEFLGRDEAVENLHEALLYSLGLDIEDRIKRGKRVRPVLCLQACEALRGDAERAMPFACAIELVHNFCLIHDDIEDGDQMRRDRPSVWSRYGVPHAINIGDYMLTKVFVMLTQNGAIADPELNLRHLQLITDTLDHTHIGQALDMNARDNVNFSMADYLRIAEEKTGYYLAAPIIGGAMAANADEATIEALRQFGQHIGPLFQIIDDLIDLTEGKGRGETGSDIGEGKRSYLVAFAAENASLAEKKRMFEILDLPREETTPEHIAEIAELFERHGALQSARDFAERLYTDAMQSIAGIPAPLKDLLETTFAHLAKRTR